MSTATPQALSPFGLTSEIVTQCLALTKENSQHVPGDRRQFYWKVLAHCTVRASNTPSMNSIPRGADPVETRYSLTAIFHIVKLIDENIHLEVAEKNVAYKALSRELFQVVGQMEAAQSPFH